MTEHEYQSAAKSTARSHDDLDSQPAIRSEHEEAEPVDARPDKKKSKEKESVTVRVLALQAARSNPTADEIREGQVPRDITILVFGQGTVHGLGIGMTATLNNAHRDIVRIVRATQDTAEATVPTTVDDTRKALAPTNELTFKRQ